MTRTNAHGVLTILARAVALFLVAELVLTAIAIATSASDDFRGLGMATIAVGLLVAGTLWLFADKLAGLALARRDAPAFESSIDPEHWQAIAFATVGVVFVADGIVGAVRQVWTAFYLAGMSQDPAYAAPSQAGEVLVVIATLAIGMTLMLGARGLARLVHRLRYASPHPLVEDEADGEAPAAAPPPAAVESAGTDDR